MFWRYFSALFCSLLFCSPFLFLYSVHWLSQSNKKYLECLIPTYNKTLWKRCSSGTVRNTNYQHSSNQCESAPSQYWPLDMRKYNKPRLDWEKWNKFSLCNDWKIRSTILLLPEERWISARAPYKCDGTLLKKWKERIWHIFRIFIWGNKLKILNSLGLRELTIYLNFVFVSENLIKTLCTTNYKCSARRAIILEIIMLKMVW